MSEEILNLLNLQHDLEHVSINEWFPNEILEEILSKLYSKSDLCNAKFVCHRWRHIVDEMVGHDITVTNFYHIIRYLSCEDGKSLSLSGSVKDVASLNNYPAMAIRHLKIGVPGMLTNDSLTLLIENISEKIPDFPQSAYPHVLQSLSCYEPLPPNIFQAFSPMGNLRYLNLSLFSLAHLSPEKSFNNSCKFRSLKTLIISETPAYPEFNSSSAIIPLNNFLHRFHAPYMTHLDVTCPIRSLLDIEEDSTRFVIDVIERSPFIKKLSITVCSPNQNFSPPAKGFQYPATLIAEMEALGKRIKLESVELKDNHLHSLRPSVQTKAWIVLIKQQENLQSLKLLLKSSIEFVGDVAQILQRNEGTLVNLDLSCFPCEISDTDDIHFVPIDSRTLSKCHFLKTLRLSDKTINTLHLPSSLSQVFIDAMMTNMDAHNVLLLSSPLLKRIDLKETRGGAPKGFGYGVALDSLHQFVENRRVQRLIIYAGSTDDKFPKEGILNGDNDNPISLLKQAPSTSYTLISAFSQESLLQNCIRIDWQLNDRGFYENTNPEFNTTRFQADVKNAVIADLHHSWYKCNTLFSTFQ